MNNRERWQIVLSIVAIASPMLLPPVVGTAVACAALLGALWVFVWAGALRGWYLAALIGAVVAAAASEWWAVQDLNL